VFTDTSPSHRTLINARWQKRNANEGTYNNGLDDASYWRFKMPAMPPAFVFSIRELVVHSWGALRGGHMRELILRPWRFAKEFIVMFLPRYSLRYGKIESLTYKDNRVEVAVRPATKYGTILHDVKVNLRK